MSTQEVYTSNKVRSTLFPILVTSSSLESRGGSSYRNFQKRGALFYNFRRAPGAHVRCFSRGEVKQVMVLRIGKIAHITNMCRGESRASV